MTISSQTRKAGPFVGNDSSTAFPFAFKVFDASDVYVVKLNTELGAESVLVLGSDYTVSLNSNQNSNPGGTVTLPAALATGYKLTITSALQYLQPTDLTNQGGFYPAVITNAFDRLTIFCQQIYERLTRSLTLPISVTGVSTSLPVPESNALVGWNIDADGLENKDPTTLATIVAFGTANADVFDGDGTTTAFALSGNPGAINNLDVSIGGVTQTPGVDYTWASGTNIEFTTAPIAGTDNILVRYMQALPQGYATAVTTSVSDADAVAREGTPKNVENYLQEIAKQYAIPLRRHLPQGYVPGRTDASGAFSAAAQEARDTGVGAVWCDGLDYLFTNTCVLDDFLGGVKFIGPSINSVGVRANILQKDITTAAFKVRGINHTFDGFSASVFAGAVLDDSGDQITVLSTTTTTMTLSADPWPSMSPVVWTLGTAYIATDGTSYSSAIRLNAQGGWVASGATKNGDGTVTLTGVKGAGGTLNSSLAGTVGYAVTAFLSLAHDVADASFTNPRAGIFDMDVRENQFFRNLWFNQCGICFAYDALGSGSGYDAGIGNAGFMENIVADQVRYYLKAAGDLNSFNCRTLELYGARHGFVVAGDMTDCQLLDLKTFQSVKVLEVAGDMIGCSLVASNIEVLTGYAYTNGFFSVAGVVQDTNISGNNFGRSTSGTATFVIGTADGLCFTSNTIASHNEGGTGGFMSVTGGTFTNSTIASNNWASRYSSSANRILFTNTAADIAGSVFGDDVFHYTNHTKLGWQAPTLLNSWTQAAGTAAVGYSKGADRIVRLRGNITGGSSATVAFTLPAGFRPSGAERRPILVSGNNLGYVDVATTGNVTVTFSASNSWLDLGSVSFFA